MASEWFYTVNGQQAPTSASDAQLEQLATSGQLRPTDMLWKEGLPNWVAASTIKGLFAASRPASREFPAPEPAPTRKPARKPTVERNDDAEGESAGGILGMHPILVFVLSLFTGGIFGLVYVYFVCSAYSAHQTRDADAAGRPLGKLRHPLGVYILSVLTFGIYYYYWIYKTLQECAAYTGRKDITARIDLALMLVLPPWAIYVSTFRLPEMIRAAQVQANQPEAGALSVAPFFVIPCLAPALPFLAMAYQDALNQVWVSAS